LWSWAPGHLTNVRYAIDLLSKSDEPQFPLLAAVTAQRLLQRGDHDAASALWEKALAAPNLGTEDEARARSVAAQSLVLRGDTAGAHEQLVRALQLAESAGMESLALQVLTSLISTHSEADALRAAEMSRQLLDRLRAHGETELLATACLKAAWYLLIAGFEDEAGRVAAEAVSLRAGELTEDNLHTVGVIALMSDEIAAASDYFTAGLRRSANIYTTIDHIEGFALLAARRKNGVRAIRLLAGADIARNHFGLPQGQWWAERLRSAEAEAEAEVRASLADAGARSATTTGARMAVEQLTEYAVNDCLSSCTTADRPLNPRENQVARLIADGHKNKQIAARLSLSVRTVEAHTMTICR
jgi:ATP/maltotriose-dependent transcriptional regulator MalT